MPSEQNETTIESVEWAPLGEIEARYGLDADEQVIIGLDARSIFMPRPRGIGRTLLDAYRRVPELAPKWRFHLYHQRNPTDLPDNHDATAIGRKALADHSNVRLRKIDIVGDRFDTWFQVRLPLALLGDQVDLMHFPANAAPAWCPVPYVVTVHDLLPLEIENEVMPIDRRRFQRGLERAVRHAAHFIVPSAATRTTLCEMFSVDPERVSVVPWAPDTAIDPRERGGDESDDIAKIRACYELDRPWLVNFAGSVKRKNTKGLLTALAALDRGRRARFELLLVGCEPRAFRETIQAEVERLGLEDCVRILEFLPHEDLPALLRGARGLLIPSLNEGFGLPIVDAQSAGTPVLAADRPVMREVAGDAALFCDPVDPDSIANGIVDLLNDDVANDLVERGYRNVERYSWDRTAEALVAVYRRCLRGLRTVQPAAVEVGV